MALGGGGGAGRANMAFVYLPMIIIYLVQAGRQAGLLGGGEDEGPVVTLDHRVGHPLEVPRPLANLVCKRKTKV